MEKDSASVDMLKQIADEDPENAKTWRAYGLALLESRRTGEAVQALQKALELNPDAVDVLYQLGDLEEALNDLGRALKNDRTGLRPLFPYLDCHFPGALPWAEIVHAFGAFLRIGIDTCALPGGPKARSIET